MAVHQQFNVGLNTSAYNQATRQIVSATGAAAQQIAAQWNNVRNGMAGATAGRKAGTGSGGLAVQVQDIAVQLQSGTKIATIIAQQGSQMASVFGPGGAVLGAGIAVTGLLVTLGQASEKLAKTGKEVRTNLAAAAGDAGALSQALAESVKQMEALAEQKKKTDAGGWAGLLDTLSGGAALVFAGGPTRKQKRADLANENWKTDNAVLLAQSNQIDMAQEEVQLAKLKADGEDRIALTYKRQIDLRRDLLKISNAIGVNDDTKAQLTEARNQLYAEETRGDKNAQRKQDGQKRLEKEKQINAEKQKQSDLQRQAFELSATDEQKISAIRMRISSAQNATSKDPLSRAKAQTIEKAGILEIAQIKKTSHERDLSRFEQQQGAYERWVDTQRDKYEKIGALRKRIDDDVAANLRKAGYIQGQFTLDRAKEIRMPAGERAKLRRDARQEKRDIRRAAEEEVNKEDRDNGRVGRDTTKERRERIQRIIDRAGRAKMKDRIEARIAPSDIQQIVKQIAELQNK